MHVLLVEDDLDTRDLVQHALRKEGCKVFQAFGVSDALRLSRMHPDIDVVVVDMHRGCRQSIEEITRQMRRRLRHGRYVLISGDWDTLEPACRGLKDTIVLRKPYGKHELLRAIGLGATRPPGGDYKRHA
jgi:DNA-binding response OmpR family regulator